MATPEHYPLCGDEMEIIEGQAVCVNCNYPNADEDWGDDDLDDDYPDDAD